MPSSLDLAEIYATNLGPCWACKPVTYQYDTVFEESIYKLKKTLWQLQGEPWIPNSYDSSNDRRFIMRKDVTSGSENRNSLCSKDEQFSLVCTCGDTYKKINLARAIRQKREFSA